MISSWRSREKAYKRNMSCITAPCYCRSIGDRAYRGDVDLHLSVCQYKGEMAHAIRQMHRPTFGANAVQATARHDLAEK